MKLTFDEYCLEVTEEAARLAEEAEMQARYEHLGSFNFGRTVGRLESARRHFWLRILWLLVGVVIGAAAGAGCLQALTAGIR